MKNFPPPLRYTVPVVIFFLMSAVSLVEYQSLIHFYHKKVEEESASEMLFAGSGVSDDRDLLALCYAEAHVA